MTENVREELRAAMELAVGKVRARADRKAVMREELMAHLECAWEEQMERGGDETSAAEAAKERFGDCEALRRELDASVPLVERIMAGILDREFRMWRTMVLCGVVAVMFGMSTILPALAKWKQMNTVPGGGLIALMMGVAVVTSGLHLVGWGIARRVRRAA
jgi:hypothetical protein